MSSPYHVIMWFRSSFSSDFDSSISILDVPVSSAIFVSANQEEQAHMLRFITVPTMRSAVLIFERCFFAILHCLCFHHRQLFILVRISCRFSVVINPKM